MLCTFAKKRINMSKNKSIINEFCRQIRVRESSGNDPVYLEDLVEYALRNGLIVATSRPTRYAFGEQASCCAIDMYNLEVVHFEKKDFERLFGRRP